MKKICLLLLLCFISLASCKKKKTMYTCSCKTKTDSVFQVTDFGEIKESDALTRCAAIQSTLADDTCITHAIN